MNNIKCIFDLNRICDDCGDCDKCDLDDGKICDNCGKCIEVKNGDMKEVRIDDIIEDIDDARNYEEEDSSTFESDNMDKEDEKNEVWEYIDDIDGLNDILNDTDKFDKYAVEEFPGFIKIKSKNK